MADQEQHGFGSSMDEIAGGISKKEGGGKAIKFAAVGVLGAVCLGGVLFLLSLDKEPETETPLQASQTTAFPEDRVEYVAPTLPTRPEPTVIVDDSAARAQAERVKTLEEQNAAMLAQLEALQTRLEQGATQPIDEVTRGDFELASLGDLEANTSEEETNALNVLTDTMRTELAQIKTAAEESSRAAQTRIEEMQLAAQRAQEQRELDQDMWENQRQAMELELATLRANAQNGNGNTGPTLEELQRQEELERQAAAQERLAQLREEERAFQQARIDSDMVMGGSGSSAGEEAAQRALSERQAFVAGAGGNVQVSKATHIARPDITVIQGSIIQAALETAIDSSLPGVIRAVVSEDVHSLDGSNILIPRGSKVFGEYQSDLSVGDSRILVAWTRIVTPSNRSVVISSFGGDDLGRSGTTGHVNRRFGERFGSAAMVSLIGATPALAASTQENELAAGVAESVGEDLATATTSTIADLINIQPTIHVAQGSRITILLDRDLQMP